MHAWPLVGAATVAHSAGPDAAALPAAPRAGAEREASAVAAEEGTGTGAPQHPAEATAEQAGAQPPAAAVTAAAQQAIEESAPTACTTGRHAPVSERANAPRAASHARTQRLRDAERRVPSLDAAALRRCDACPRGRLRPPDGREGGAWVAAGRWGCWRSRGARRQRG